MFLFPATTIAFQILSLVDAIAEVHAESLKWDPEWAVEFMNEEKMKGMEQFVGMMKVHLVLAYTLRTLELK